VFCFQRTRRTRGEHVPAFPLVRVPVERVSLIRSRRIESAKKSRPDQSRGLASSLVRPSFQMSVRRRKCRDESHRESSITLSRVHERALDRAESSSIEEMRGAKAARAGNISVRGRRELDMNNRAWPRPGQEERGLAFMVFDLATEPGHGNGQRPTGTGIPIPLLPTAGR